MLLAGALLVLLLALVPWRWRSLTEFDRARLLPLLPRTSQERALYAPLAMVAGIGEELVYRGAMFALLERLTGNAWAAALLAAASFAVGHAVQGAATAALVGVVALAFQGLAAATGALYAGMTVHPVFDLSVGLLARRILGGPTFDVRVEQKQVDGSPVPGSVHQEQLPAEGGFHADFSRSRCTGPARTAARRARRHHPGGDRSVR